MSSWFLVFLKGFTWTLPLHGSQSCTYLSPKYLGALPLCQAQRRKQTKALHSRGFHSCRSPVLRTALPVLPACLIPLHLQDWLKFHLFREAFPNHLCPRGLLVPSELCLCQESAETSAQMDHFLQTDWKLLVSQAWVSLFLVPRCATSSEPAGWFQLTCLYDPTSDR